MVNISRRNFIKNSAMALMSYSLPGCASAFGANKYDEKYGYSPNYHNGKFKNLIKTSEGRKSKQVKVVNQERFLKWLVKLFSARKKENPLLNCL
jgi:hypothetical protein